MGRVVQAVVTRQAALEPDRRASKRLPPWLFAIGIGAVVALGILARIVIWLSPYGVPEADEATGG